MYVRVFHHTQSFQYLFTENDGTAYVIPATVLPHDWYTSNAEYGTMPMASVSEYKINLRKKDWVTDFLHLLQRTRHLVEEGLERPRERVARRFIMDEGSGEFDESTVTTTARANLDQILVDDDLGDDGEGVLDVTGGESRSDFSRWLSLVVDPARLQNEMRKTRADQAYLQLLKSFARQ